MNDNHEVTIPLINANEPEALLAGLHVKDGQQVARGDLLCTLETTKSAAEITAEQDGYIAGLRLEAGQTVHAGEVLCYLASSPDWQPPPVDAAPEAIRSGAPKDWTAPAGLRLTQPARALAQQHNLDLSQLPAGSLVTESTVRSLLASSQPGKTAAPDEFASPDTAFDPTAIIIYGGGGHGKSLIELVRALHAYSIVGVIDDGLNAQVEKPSILGVPVLGGAEGLPELYRRGVRLAVNAVGGIGNLSVRVKVFQRLAEAGFTCPAVVHPSAVIEPSASLSPGVQVFPLAYVGSEARLGFGVIVNTRAVVSHDCSINDYANLSPGATLAGEVQVESGVLIGMGATVNLRTHIGRGARIGNGATVKSDVPAGGIVRAGSIWPPA